MLNRSKRWLSMLLAVVMCMSILVLPVAATEEAPGAAERLPASELTLEEIFLKLTTGDFYGNAEDGGAKK